MALKESVTFMIRISAKMIQSIRSGRERKGLWGVVNQLEPREKSGFVCLAQRTEDLDGLV